MRKWLALLSGVVSMLGLAGSASAAPLNWEGTFTAILSDLGEVANSGGGVATVNDSAGVIPAHLQTLRLKGSRGGVIATETILITDPDTINNGIHAVVVEASLGTGTFAPISGGAASTSVLTRDSYPVRGQARVCLVTTDCSSQLLLPLTVPTLTINGALGGGVDGVGVGGLLTAGADSNIKISLQAAPWTIKTAVVSDQITTINEVNQSTPNLTAKGFAHDPNSSTTSTAQPSGVVQLVTPAQVKTNLPLGSSKTLGILATLRVHFIPEPGLLLLIGSGVMGLAIMGRKRMRK
jgi:hypothetical protein